MNSGKVIVLPAVKLVMTKSSIDRLNASSAAAMMPGRMSGKVTFQNVVHSFAPRSIAASSRWRREARQPGPHGHHHEADVEHDVGDEDRHAR